MVSDLKSDLVMTSSQHCPNMHLMGNPAVLSPSKNSTIQQFLEILTKTLQWHDSSQLNVWCHSSYGFSCTHSLDKHTSFLYSNSSILINQHDACWLNLSGVSAFSDLSFHFLLSSVSYLESFFILLAIQFLKIIRVLTYFACAGVHVIISYLFEPVWPIVSQRNT